VSTSAEFSTVADSRRLADASRAQGLRDSCGESCEFVQLAFAERGVLVDHEL
jgi:hypothetical protein